MSTKFPELVFALVGPMGTDLELVGRSLRDSLIQVGYTPVDVKLSDLLRNIYPDLPQRQAINYYREAISKGNELRARLDRPDAMAALAMASIRRRREKNEDAEQKNERRAYILTSLKRPEEVDLLRDVYGGSVFIISAYAPRDSRVDRVAAQQAEREYRNQIADHRSDAEALIRKDESESSDYGQDVRKTYPLADLFVNTSAISTCSEEIERFVALIFGHPWHTPKPDEQNMAIAYLASLRSGSAARQVGAALANASGNLLSVGTNEVPAPGGGQYWEGNANDGRDQNYGSTDTSDKMRMNLLSDVLHRLKNDAGILRDDVDLTAILEPNSPTYALLRKAQLFDTIDYIRAVHAEASALFSASGPTLGGTLYVTTFPCHECARHIVTCGIIRVVYIEPYPKSLVTELFSDSIQIDLDHPNGKVQFVPFTGISPTVYQHLFSITRKKRKANDGTIIRWIPSESQPRLHISYSEPATTEAEHGVLKIFEAKLKEKGLSYDSVSGAT